MTFEKKASRKPAKRFSLSTTFQLISLINSKIISFKPKNLINTAKKILTDFELRVFDLRINNFNYSEMATLLNRSNKSIDNAIRRIKMKLKKALNEKDN